MYCCRRVSWFFAGKWRFTATISVMLSTLAWRRFLKIFISRKTLLASVISSRMVTFFTATICPAQGTPCFESRQKVIRESWIDPRELNCDCPDSRLQQSHQYNAQKWAGTVEGCMPATVVLVRRSAHIGSTCHGSNSDIYGDMSALGSAWISPPHLLIHPCSSTHSHRLPFQDLAQKRISLEAQKLRMMHCTHSWILIDAACII